MSNSVNIVVTADSGQAIRAFRDVNGQLRDMSGRFVSEGNTMSGAMNRVSGSIAGVKGSIIPLASAAVPLAAAFAPIAAKAGGASLAVAAFGVAVAGQVAHLSEASEAQKAYTDAVAKHGRGSQQAASAQLAVSQTLAGMPEATQRAAIGFQTLKGTYREFSDSTAKFTMAPVEKSFAVLGEVIPKLKPMVQGSSEQLERLVTVAGGAVASPEFDAFSERMSKFANSALKDAVDGAISFTRALSEGEASGPLKSFMEYAEQNGPAMRETLSSVGDAVSTLVEAAADAGPGMLTLVNAAAGLVAALPPELVTVLMQTAVALKLVGLAGAGAAAASGGVAALGARIAAMGAASAAAGGGLAGVNAALNTMGTGGKAMLAAGAVGALVLVMHKLSDNKAPVTVDELSASLNTLATTGKVTGGLKANFSEMSESIAMMGKGASDNKLVQLASDFGTFVGIASGPSVSDAAKHIDAWDKTMANNVKAGHPKVAAAQFEILKKAWVAGNGDLAELKEETTDYSDALAAQKFEQDQIAQSMGVFGKATQDTTAKLEAQKLNADGLRSSILALNEVNRSAHDAETNFERTLDSLTASFKEHGATLDKDTAAGQANRDMMSQASQAQGEFIVTGLAAGDSLASMTSKSEELRSKMMSLATDAFGGNKKAAEEYVNTLLGAPSEIKTLIELERQEAISGLEDVQTAIRKTPGAKSVKVNALSQAAIGALEAVGLKTEQLPDGRTRVYTANGKSLGSIGAVRNAMDRLDGKKANTWTFHNVRTTHTTVYRIQGRPGGPPSGTYFGSTAGRSADGNIYAGRSFADGGMENHVAQIAQPTMRLWAEPETGGEAYIPLAVGKRPRSLAILEDVADRFGYGLEKFARGGVTKSEREARKSAAGELTVSYFGRRAGFKNPEFRNQLGGGSASVGDLSSSLNKWRSVIKKATHGGVERSLLRSLDRSGRALLKHEKKLVSVNKALDKAKDKLSDLKSAASQLSGSVKSGIISGGNITKAAGAEDAQVTMSTLLSQMGGSAGNAKQFASMLKQLKSRGLAKDLIAQVAEAGVEGGGMETAAAILGGGVNDIKQLNSLQKSLTSAAGSAGKTAADAMYGAGIKAAEGLVKGLQKKQDSIEKQMMKIAKSMEKAIKRALKIKSPSQVMEEVGDYTAEGFATGMRKNRSVTPAWQSMLTVPPGASGRASSAGGGRGVVQPVVVHQTITLDGRVVAQQIFDPLRKEVAVRGGNVQSALGQRTN